MKNFELSWSEITVSVKIKKSMCLSEEKKIIENASGLVKSGSFVAIMGPSGAGKTSLLSTLGGKIENFKGSVQLNGRKLSIAEIKAISGFMNQFFIATEHLTVEEYLMFMVALKTRIQPGQQQDTVKHLISNIGLELCKNTEIRYLSGGEKRKVSLATETLTDPLILYCDEPTTGLDTTSAIAVIKDLQTKTASGKIVMFTIHQPPSQLYNYFDQIILLAYGQIIFHGSKNLMEDFFKSINLHCPKLFNPAEFYVNHVLSKKKADLQILQRKAISFMKMQETCSSAFFDLDDSVMSLLKLQQKIQLCYELKWLLWRSYINAKRSLKDYAIALGLLMITAVVVGILFSETLLDNTGVKNYNGILYFTSSEIIYSFMFSVLYEFSHEYGIFLAEESVYSPYSYFMAKVVCLVPRCVIFTLCFLSIIYVRIQLPGGFYQFAMMYVIACVGSISSALFGLCVSANFRKLHNITAVIMPWTTVSALAAGMFIKITSIPMALQWIKYLSPFYYIFQSLAIIQWINVLSIDCLSGDRLPCYQNGTAVLESLGVTPSYSQVLKNLLCITIVSICWGLIGLFGITRKYRIKLNSR